MLKANNGATTKVMKRKHYADIPLLPCSCQVAVGRAMSFEAVQNIMDDYCRKVNAKLQVKDVGVGAKDENAEHASTVWVIDFKYTEERFSSKSEILKAVKECVTPLQGYIDGVSRTKIRAVVPVSQRHCMAGSGRSGKVKK